VEKGVRLIERIVNTRENPDGEAVMIVIVFCVVVFWSRPRYLIQQNGISRVA
jgi:hypothetical protein